MEIIINKEYIESHLGKKITQSQANHIISKIGDNDGLWDILHESIENASEEVCNESITEKRYDPYLKRFVEGKSCADKNDYHSSIGGGQ